MITKTSNNIVIGAPRSGTYYILRAITACMKVIDEEHTYLGEFFSIYNGKIKYDVIDNNITNLKVDNSIKERYTNFKIPFTENLNNLLANNNTYTFKIFAAQAKHLGNTNLCRLLYKNNTNTFYIYRTDKKQQLMSALLEWPNLQNDINKYSAGLELENEWARSFENDVDYVIEYETLNGDPNIDMLRFFPKHIVEQADFSNVNKKKYNKKQMIENLPKHVTSHINV